MVQVPPTRRSPEFCLLEQDSVSLECCTILSRAVSPHRDQEYIGVVPAKISTPIGSFSGFYLGTGKILKEQSKSLHPNLNRRTSASECTSAKLKTSRQNFLLSTMATQTTTTITPMATQTTMRNSKTLLRTTLGLLGLCMSTRFVPGSCFHIGIISATRGCPSRRSPRSSISSGSASDRSAWMRYNRRQSANSVFLATASSSSDETDDASTPGDVNVSTNMSTAGSTSAAVTVTSTQDSPVLRQVYPVMLQHVQDYGHPNIPLGIPAGRQCETLRRLHTQQKLSANDVMLLDSIEFRWHSLEDVANTADFQELFARLVQYSVDNGGEVSPPKKYPADPELGAWVTGLRRVGVDDMDAERVRALEEIGFLWSSPRQCGSAFMMQYRDILERLNVASADSASAADSVLSDPEVQQWIQAQREAVKRGTLSETRQHYMESVAGVDWLVG
jgi:hypothetical protein